MVEMWSLSMICREYILVGVVAQLIEHSVIVGRWFKPSNRDSWCLLVRHLTPTAFHWLKASTNLSLIIHTDWCLTMFRLDTLPTAIRQIGHIKGQVPWSLSFNVDYALK